jgi:RNA-binding protein
LPDATFPSTLAGMTQPLTNAEKRDLKARAQRLDAMLRLGSAGVSDAFLKSLDEALTLHGLVKIKFTEFKEEKKSLAPEIAEKTGSELIMRVGNVAVYYRPKVGEA